MPVLENQIQYRAICSARVIYLIHSFAFLLFFLEECEESINFLCFFHGLLAAAFLFVKFPHVVISSTALPKQSRTSGAVMDRFFAWYAKYVALLTKQHAVQQDNAKSFA